MGCAQSRIDNEESVSRCKDRKNLIKDAVIARNAFAAGHSGYAVALKDTGAALSDYGHGEAEELHQQPVEPTTSQPPPPPPPPMDNFLPPPPLPNFSPSPGPGPGPMKRTTSLPAMPIKPRKTRAIAIAEEEEDEEEEEGEDDDESNIGIKNNVIIAKDSRNGAGEEVPPLTPEMKAVPPMPESKGMAWDYFFMVEENMPPAGQSLNENVSCDNINEGAAFGEETQNLGPNGSDLVEPKTPERVEEREKQMERTKTAPEEFKRVGKAVPSVSLMKVLSELDDHFLKASQSAQEVSNMLEATRLHYHSNFADNRGHIDHSERVMRVITWNKSFRAIATSEGEKDDFDSEENETHATVLDKLLAWEKKLHQEVKQGELMKLEYQRKVSLLNKQKKRNVSAESLEKTKAAVSHLHTRYIVDMQSMDSTVLEVNRLRDEQLYPKLVELVDGMAKMWATMRAHHSNQLRLVTDLKSLDIAHAPKETTKHHHDRTIQLWNVVEKWHSQFEKLATHQKQYIRALNSWLKLNLIPIESSLKEKISSPPRVQHPPIQTLLQSWHDHLEKLPDELVKSAIGSFAAVIKTIILHQEEEMKLKEKCEETRKEFLRKNQAFEEWYEKYMQRRGPDEMDPERGEDANPKDPISEKKFAVESLKKRLEEEVESHQTHCIQVREKSLGCLKTRLPELFRAMSGYAHACSDTYEKVRSVTQYQKSDVGPTESEVRHTVSEI
ncbi:hypothetical protein F2P56_017660 [Juglans regia]|uniref:Nitrate regulatory gene2 protein-like n=1 Tax=Juglans regia TaxID=51240 RepID=A0A833V061_JUGRE|nr:hypothetical protein F2P56_017660 [Juglans regia]